MSATLCAVRDASAEQRDTGGNRLLRRYVRTVGPPPLRDIETWLWEPGDGGGWDRTSDAYRATLLEQYKIYVEMADRVSARRGAANTLFLSLNTAVVTAIGVLWQDPPRTAPWLATPVLLALLVQCAGWFWTLRSYRQLNAAKYAVVGALERRLPASPYWSAEWAALGEGRDPARYWPLSHVEQNIPGFFAAVYVTGFVLLLAA